MGMVQRILWIFFFGMSQFFMSFIINCGEDLPYDRTSLEEEEASGSVNVDCDCSGFLIASCVDQCEDEMGPAESDTEGVEDQTDQEEDQTDEEDQGSAQPQGGQPSDETQRYR